MTYINEKIKEFEEKVRQICTYYSELGEGTAGYSLSEEQFEKLFKLFSTALSEAYEKGFEDARKETRLLQKIIISESKRKP
jgi:hypothetical protein